MLLFHNVRGDMISAAAFGAKIPRCMNGKLRCVRAELAFRVNPTGLGGEILYFLG